MIYAWNCPCKNRWFVGATPAFGVQMKLEPFFLKYRWFSMILWLFVIFLVLFNLIAYQQAHAMLHFTTSGTRTARIEYLSVWQKIKVLFSGAHIPKPLNAMTPKNFGLSFETHQINVTDKIVLEAWYIPHPQPKGIILLFHGYAASKSRLLPAAHAFHEMSYETFLVDFRGSGGSNQSTTSLGYFEADDVSKAIQYVQTQFSHLPINVGANRRVRPFENNYLKHHIILYGQSMGSAAILRAIHTNHIQPNAIIIEAVFGNLLTTVKNRFDLMGLPSFPAAHLLVFWGSIQSGFSGFEHNPVDYAKQVHCPTLMLHGTEDRRANIHEAETVFNNLRGPKQLERFEGLKHESYSAARFEQWKRSISQFLAAHI